MSVVIIFTDPDGKESELMLIENAVIGRSSKADFTLNDSRISGRHCKLTLTKKGTVEFTDLNSTNGSFLGNSKITSHLLKVGEKIRIGESYIYIDSKRLSTLERNIIGTARIDLAGGVDLPSNMPVSPKTTSIVKPNAEIFEKKSYPSQRENTFEKEKSTGKTKMLKVNKTQDKKKK